MADEIDAAQDAEERHLAAALKARQPVVCATGYCAYCNERIGSQRVFCDMFCSNFWHLDQKVKKIKGFK